MQLKLGTDVYAARMAAVRERLGERGLDALYLSSPVDIFYVAGCPLSTTERPIALLIPLRGEPVLLIPCLEREHAREVAPHIKELCEYFEYPGLTPPVAVFAERIRRLGLGAARIGIDRPAAGGMGYQGPTLSGYLPQAEFVPAGDLVLGMRLVKSDLEVEYFRESAAWGTKALHALKQAATPGRSEIEVGMEVSCAVTRELLQALGPDYMFVFGFGYGPAFAVFSCGEATAYPHPIDLNRTIKPGDTIICGLGATIGGYNAELERTLFVGEPSPEKRRYFELAREIQEFAITTLRPGRAAADAETEIRRFIAGRGCLDMVRHRTGHGLGLEIHEPPWIDEGERTVLEPGMLVSCEPGLYVPGLCGFRHSDTVLITAAGPEVLTRAAAKDLESMIIHY